MLGIRHGNLQKHVIGIKAGTPPDKIFNATGLSIYEKDLWFFFSPPDSNSHFSPHPKRGKQDTTNNIT